LRLRELGFDLGAKSKRTGARSCRLLPRLAAVLGEDIAVEPVP